MKQKFNKICFQIRCFYIYTYKRPFILFSTSVLIYSSFVPTSFLSHFIPDPNKPQTPRNHSTSVFIFTKVKNCSRKWSFLSCSAKKQLRFVIYWIFWQSHAICERKGEQRYFWFKKKKKKMFPRVKENHICATEPPIIEPLSILITS